MNRNDQQFMAQKIRTQYMEKEFTELDALLEAYPEPIRLVGDGYGVTLQDLTHPVIAIPDRLRNQSAYSVAQVARRLYAEGVRMTDAELVATYLRPSQAERERQERLQASAKES